MSNPSEDRIQVLRGQAEILIRESREHITVHEGEELVVKTGGRTEKIEIDIDREQTKLQAELGKLGDTIQLGEIQDTLFQMRENEAENFKKLQDAFKALSNKESVSDAEEQELRKTSERLAGVLLEDALIMNAIQKKLEKALADPGTSPAEKSQVAGYMKSLAATKAVSQGFQSEISKIMKVEFRAPTASIKPEVEVLKAELKSSKESLDNILREVSAGTGLSQDWFASSQDVVNGNVQALSEAMVRVTALLEKNPTDAELIALVKNLQAQQSQFTTLLKGLNVKTIDASILTEMQDSEGQLGDMILNFKSQLEADRARAGKADLADTDYSPTTLRDLAKIMQLYKNAQRLYESEMKGSSGQRFRTAEQEELLELYERIANIFHSIGLDFEKVRLVWERRLAGYGMFDDKTTPEWLWNHLNDVTYDSNTGLTLIFDAGYDGPGRWKYRIDYYSVNLCLVHINDFRPPGSPPVPGTSTLLGSYSHLSWGEWSSQTTIPDLVNFTETHWISGSLTPGINIPVQGGASYNGQVLGSLNEAGAVSRISGTTNLFADFSTRSLSGSFDMVRNNGNPWTNANLNAAWGAGVNAISGTLSSNNGMSGTVSGNFFGPAAEQVGGKWNMQDNNNQATGIFVATQPQPN
ncbi:MAG: transferrin-binding protein-like solute binding protein [Geobacteraceae bacterium]|nr:transferrin-binding protein-like solute binding protein [Geobacteraceae bacterium]